MLVGKYVISGRRLFNIFAFIVRYFRNTIYVFAVSSYFYSFLCNGNKFRTSVIF